MKYLMTYLKWFIILNLGAVTWSMFTGFELFKILTPTVQTLGGLAILVLGTNFVPSLFISTLATAYHYLEENIK